MFTGLKKKPASTKEAKDLKGAPLSNDLALSFGSGATISTLVGSSSKPSRAREAIYQKWNDMEANPFINRALRIHVMAALMGEEKTGDAVLVDTRSGFEKEKKYESLIDEIKAEIVPIFNRIDQTVAYNAITFGDGYGRIYADKQRGVYDVLVDELVRPPLIQPFEQASKTVGYIIQAGDKPIDKLTPLQMARMKIPRMTWIPQPSVIEKNHRMLLSEDDSTKLPILPSMVGGSVLYAAESVYDDFTKSLLAMVGQRWADSIDESVLALNMKDMTKDQQNSFKKNIVSMLHRSKKINETAVKNSTPFLEKLWHVIPVSDEKQVTQVTGGISSGRTGQISIEDVLFHAKTLTGVLGVDLSMVGFSELLSGGMGDGGFFRTSAQLAESSGTIRKSLAAFCNHILDVHTYHKYGFVFSPSERPWEIKFYGSISALENEKENTKLQAMNSGSMLVAVIQQLKDMGADEETAKQYLSKQMMLDEGEAKIYAKIVNAKPDPEQGEGIGAFGGGM